jgi:single-strand DNA-binding protein
MTATLTVVGRLVRGPELKYLDSGKAMARFSIAEARRIRHGDEWTDGPTTFWSVTVFGKAAENMTNSQLANGDELVIVGRPEGRTWERDGQKHTAVDLTADTVGVTFWRRPVEPIRDTPTAPLRSAEKPTWDDSLAPF